MTNTEQHQQYTQRNLGTPGEFHHPVNINCLHPLYQSRCRLRILTLTLTLSLTLMLTINLTRTIWLGGEILRECRNLLSINIFSVNHTSIWSCSFHFNSTSCSVLIDFSRQVSLPWIKYLTHLLLLSSTLQYMIDLPGTRLTLCVQR